MNCIYCGTKLEQRPATEINFTLKDAKEFTNDLLNGADVSKYFDKDTSILACPKCSQKREENEPEAV